MIAVHPCADVKILQIFKEWVDLQSDIDNDAVLWNKLREQTKIALQTYKKNAKPKVRKKFFLSPLEVEFCHILSRY